MANLKQLESSKTTQRRNRYFSEDLRRRLVRDLDQNLVTIAEICREHRVSRGAVYKWVYKYSCMKKKGIQVVVESKSLTKQVALLKAKVKDLEQLVGQKQVTIEFLEKMIELSEKELGIDIKKKGGKQP